MLTPDEKLELLSLSNDDFADGLARLVKLFTNEREDKSTTVFTPPGGGSEIGNYLLLEDNTPFSGE